MHVCCSCVCVWHQNGSLKTTWSLRKPENHTSGTSTSAGRYSLCSCSDGMWISCMQKVPLTLQSMKGNQYRTVSRWFNYTVYVRTYIKWAGTNVNVVLSHSCCMQVRCAYLQEYWPQHVHVHAVFIFEGFIYYVGSPFMYIFWNFILACHCMHRMYTLMSEICTRRDIQEQRQDISRNWHEEVSLNVTYVNGCVTSQHMTYVVIHKLACSIRVCQCVRF